MNVNHLRTFDTEAECWEYLQKEHARNYKSNFVRVYEVNSHGPPKRCNKPKI